MEAIMKIYYFIISPPPAHLLLTHRHGHWPRDMTEQLWDAISRQDLADMANILSQLPSSVQVDTYNMVKY